MFSTKCQIFWIRNCRSRSLSFSAVNLATHYDVLELSSKATISEIKTAYYRLSKLYHPDISDNDESAKKFRSITEAYEVLGNIRTRKLYDRGFLGVHHDHDVHAADYPKETLHKAHLTKHRVGGMHDSHIYDFDAWTKEHYGKTFDRTQRRKTTMTREDAHNQWIQNSMKTEKIIILALGFVVIMMYIAHDSLDVANENIVVNESDN